jgi:GT2 family glycosyltransferase
MTLSIIIVNHNVRFFLEQCLLSVGRAAEGMACEVIVVDNASRDESRGYLTARFPAVRFLWNEENVGFGRACNQGTAVSTGEYILFLNPDTIVPEDCLRRCLEHMAVHPRGGALGVRMHDGSGFFLRESKRSYPSPSTAFLKLSGLSRLFPASPLFARYDLGHRDAYVSCPADVLAGAFLMVRRSALAVTGGFDERFFMYGEDIDLCWRLRQAGFENLYFADAAILHFKGESNRRDSLRHVRSFYGAMVVFVRKHESGLRAALLFPAIVLRAGLSVIRIGMVRLLGWLRFGSMSGLAREVWVCAPDGHLTRVVDVLGRTAGVRVCRVSWDVLQGGPEGVVSGPARELVVCPPACGYGRFLDLLSEHPGRYRIRVSAEGSGGIVGSGLVMAM